MDSAFIRVAEQVRQAWRFALSQSSLPRLEEQSLQPELVPARHVSTDRKLQDQAGEEAEGVHWIDGRGTAVHVGERRVARRAVRDARSRVGAELRVGEDVAWADGRGDKRPSEVEQTPAAAAAKAAAEAAAEAAAAVAGPWLGLWSHRRAS